MRCLISLDNVSARDIYIFYRGDTCMDGKARISNKNKDTYGGYTWPYCMTWCVYDTELRTHNTDVCMTASW